MFSHAVRSAPVEQRHGMAGRSSKDIGGIDHMKVTVKKVKLSQIKLNPDNPQRIGKKGMERLVAIGQAGAIVHQNNGAVAPFFMVTHNMPKLPRKLSAVDA